MNDKSTKNRRSPAPFTVGRSNNPLAAARKGLNIAKQRHDPTDENDQGETPYSPLANPKISTKVEQQWHKRSGAGLQLFVEYYCGQPKGVIIGDRDMPSSQEDGNIGETSQASTRGMSRAAQRRRKRKRNNKEGVLGQVESSSMTTQSKALDEIHRSSSSSMFTPRRLYDDQLLSILESRMQQSDDIAKRIKANLQSYKAFFAALSTPLPLTFRLRRSLRDSDVETLQKELRTSKYSLHVETTKFDSQVYHAHQGLDKRSLAQVCPALKEFLNRHSGDGSVARQELGSMLPVWLLERAEVFKLFDKAVQGRRILDLCASPGSKTLQALEINLLTSKVGTVRANDINESRLQALKDAIQRSGVKGVDQMIKYSNFDASIFPIPKTEGKKYPVVLCDVPCSGDGTCRKDPHIIPTWLPTIGNNLHAIQTKILVRALQCVAESGVVSYSTCSMNPVEDEAVVAAALLQMHELNPLLKYEIMDVSAEQMKGLLLHPGVREWRVANYSIPFKSSNGDHPQQHLDDFDEDEQAKLVWYKCYEDARIGKMDFVSKSMWPELEALDISSSLPRCFRLFPHDQNTGGFFVALVKRVQ